MRWNAFRTVNSIDDMNDAIIGLVADAQKNLNVSDEQSFDLRLILSELTINALTYSGAPVYISAGECCPQNMHLLVSNSFDTNFDPCKYMYEPPDNSAYSGRGIFIANCLSQAMSYSKRSGSVLVRVRISADK